MLLLYLLLLLPLLGCNGSEVDLGPPLTADAAEGQKVFLELTRPRCGRCHILRHAGVEGKRGNDLDEVKPSKARVIRVVQRGIGAMKPQDPELSPVQLEQLAIYVAEVAGRGLDTK